jgi:energy-coupling factor transporter ATP-binding protein EcfA2
LNEAGILVDYAIAGILPKGFKQKSSTYDSIKIKIDNLKNIKSFEWKFELKHGLMAVIGNNGVGKSSFIITLAKIIHPDIFRLELIGNGYKETHIIYQFIDTNNHQEENYIWNKPTTWQEKSKKIMPKLLGYFESSILTGKRFRIYNNLKTIEVNENEDDIQKASEFLRTNMNYIMYGKDSDDERFKTLCKVLGKRKKKQLDGSFQTKEYTWYVLKIDDHYVNEYFFSTGEYFLLSLFKFIENLMNKRKDVSMIIIDEIELSLHSLAQKRLIEKLKEFSELYNLMVIFTTHSLQIIEEINPKNIFYFQNINGNCKISAPSYPGYLTSRLEQHKYYDRIILVEDSLAEMLIIEVLKTKAINQILYKIIPIGGWEKVLEIYEINESKKIFSDAQVLIILDGDIKEKANKGRYSRIEKRFLPLDNIEKYIATKIVDEDQDFFSFIEAKVSPKQVSELDYTLKTNPLENTNNIKDTYHHFLKAVQKEMAYTSYDELQKSMIQYILNENKTCESYINFHDVIVTFLNS